MQENKYGLAVTTYPTTPHGVHWASYPGWEGDDEIISDGGYVDGVYIRPAEVDTVDLFNRLSEEVQAEMEPLAGGDPADWNGRILELRGRVSPRDEELLSALWIAEEVYDGEVTVYGTDSDVSEMDEDDFRRLGLSRVATDEDDDEDDEDDESPTIPTDDDEPRMTKNKWGLAVTTWPTTEQGCHSATYLGWSGDDDYEIISAGGWFDGKYIPSHEVWGPAGLYDQLSPDVRDEMDSLDGQGTGGATPAEWNDKILELEKKGVSPEDEKLLDALWIEGEVFNGSTTIYGSDDDVSEMDEDDFRRLGLSRVDSDEDEDDM